MIREGRAGRPEGRIREHLRSNVIGYVALFIALTGGTAYALDGSNTVFSDDIVDGEVQTADLGTNAVRSAKIENGQVSLADLATNSVNSPRLVNDSVNGVDVDESTLGAVPQAANAETLDGQDSTDFGVGIMGGRMNGVGAGLTGNRPPIGLSTTTGSFASPAAGTFVARDLRISLTSANSAAQTRTFTFIKAGSSTALSCTVPASGASCSDTANAVTVGPGTTYAIAQTATTGAPGTVDVQFGWRAVSP